MQHKGSLKNKTEAKSCLWPTRVARLLPEIIDIFITNPGILSRCYRLDCVGVIEEQIICMDN